MWRASEDTNHSVRGWPRVRHVFTARPPRPLLRPAPVPSDLLMVSRRRCVGGGIWVLLVVTVSKQCSACLGNGLGVGGWGMLRLVGRPRMTHL
jgi:hypothetical protein